ncbi:YbaB/EbfC family nucleoid-associated protein [Sulfurospirillum sp. 1612]|uniref:YbaB/EbfC family nucleoid-associated protein n=1 Tax=Sulfurospirillum sp. 1612 TaxID=3094835 RepID=UPI002F92D383
MFENIDLSKMGEMLEMAQEQAKKMEEEAKSKEFTAKSGGGLVSVSLNGAGEVFDLSIDDSLLEDKESMQILLISAINDGIKMVEDDKKLAASQMLSGMGNFNK